jgi:MFS family permease
VSVRRATASPGAPPPSLDGVEQDRRGAAEAAPAGGRPASRTALLVTVACGTLLNPLNSSLIAVALANIRDDFALSFADAAWLISAYYLASAVGQPVLGRLADLFGRRRLFVSGLLVVAVASALAPLAPTFEWLVVLRVVQALGSSTLFPAGMGIIRAFVTDRQGQALSVLSVFSSVSAGFGPTLGGYLVAWASWPAIFLVNLPFAALALVLALRVLPRDRGVAARTPAGGGAALLRSRSVARWPSCCRSPPRRGGGRCRSPPWPAQRSCGSSCTPRRRSSTCARCGATAGSSQSIASSSPST